MSIKPKPISRKGFIEIAGFTLVSAAVTAALLSFRNSNGPMKDVSYMWVNDLMHSLAYSERISEDQFLQEINLLFPSQSSVMLIGESHDVEEQDTLAFRILAELSKQKKIKNFRFEENTIRAGEKLPDGLVGRPFNAWNISTLDDLSQPEAGTVLSAGNMHIDPRLHKQWAFNENDHYYRDTQASTFITLADWSRQKGIEPIILTMLPLDDVYRDAEGDMLRPLWNGIIPEPGQVTALANGFRTQIRNFPFNQIYREGKQSFIYISPPVKSQYLEAGLLDSAFELASLLKSKKINGIKLPKLQFADGFYINNYVIPDAGVIKNYLRFNSAVDQQSYFFFFPVDDNNDLILSISKPKSDDIQYINIPRMKR